MGTLTFQKHEVQKLIEHARSSKKFRSVFGSPQQPGLFLVGDNGVYLMSNGNPGLRNNDGHGAFVAYAKGMNPKIDSNWQDAMQQQFGDKATEFLDAQYVEDMMDSDDDTLHIVLTDEQMYIATAESQ